MKSATSSPVHLCFALPYFEQASYIFFNSSSVKGSLCLACSISRPFGFFTARAGLRVIHSLLTQYSKNGLSIAIRRAPVRGLIAHEVRNSLTSEVSHLSIMMYPRAVENSFSLVSRSRDFLCVPGTIV